jgi:hypothetical protein
VSSAIAATALSLSQCPPRSSVALAPWYLLNTTREAAYALMSEKPDRGGMVPDSTGWAEPALAPSLVPVPHFPPAQLPAAGCHPSRVCGRVCVSRRGGCKRALVRDAHGRRGLEHNHIFTLTVLSEPPNGFLDLRIGCVLGLVLRA